MDVYFSGIGSKAFCDAFDFHNRIFDKRKVPNADHPNQVYMVKNCKMLGMGDYFMALQSKAAHRSAIVRSQRYGGFPVVFHCVPNLKNTHLVLGSRGDWFIQEEPLIEVVDVFSTAPPLRFGRIEFAYPTRRISFNQLCTLT